MQRCECDYLFVPAKKKQVSAHEKRVGSQVGEVSEGSINLAGGACAHDMQLKSERMRAVLQYSRFGLYNGCLG